MVWAGGIPEGITIELRGAQTDPKLMDAKGPPRELPRVPKEPPRVRKAPPWDPQGLHFGPFREHFEHL